MGEVSRTRCCCCLCRGGCQEILKRQFFDMFPIRNHHTVDFSEFHLSALALFRFYGVGLGLGGISPVDFVGVAPICACTLTFGSGSYACASTFAFASPVRGSGERISRERVAFSRGAATSAEDCIAVASAAREEA